MKKKSPKLLREINTDVKLSYYKDSSKDEGVDVGVNSKQVSWLCILTSCDTCE